MNENLYKEIPSEFLSATTGEPFTHCIECEKSLLENDTEYLIEKAIKNYPDYKAQDTIFDYAICMDCAQKMNSRLSAESLNAIADYFATNVDLEKKAEKESSGDLNLMTKHCMVKQKAKNESTEYQLYAQCRGDKLFMGNPPYMICGEAMDEVTDLLSNETREELGGFFDKHFSPDPTLFEEIPKKKLILI